jgi:hemoglobin-like flavoprotein
MTAKNIELVKQSWTLITQMDMETIGGLFYKRLFIIAPEVKPMFDKISIPEQSKKLLTMLSYIIVNIDNLETIADDIAKLAKRHVAYGVKDEHYHAVGNALLWTLGQGFGKYWNEDLNGAWTEIYTTLADAITAVEKD